MFLRLCFPLIELGFLKAYGFKDEDELVGGFIYFLVKFSEEICC